MSPTKLSGGHKKAPENEKKDDFQKKEERKNEEVGHITHDHALPGLVRKDSDDKKDPKKKNE